MACEHAVFLAQRQPVAADRRPQPLDHKGMVGKAVSLISLDALSHAQDLFSAFRGRSIGPAEDHQHIGPFYTASAVTSWINSVSGRAERPFFAVVDHKGAKTSGFVSLRRGVTQTDEILIETLVIDMPAITLAQSQEILFLILSRVFDDFAYRALILRCARDCDACIQLAQSFGFAPCSDTNTPNHIADYRLTSAQWSTLKHQLDMHAGAGGSNETPSHKFASLPIPKETP